MHVPYVTGASREIKIRAVIWFLPGLSIALGLADYLIKIFLPSSPALLDCTELARSNHR
jgi:hypothetical protein